MPRKSLKMTTSRSSISTAIEQHCACCGSAQIQLKHVTRSFGHGVGLLLIENIPLWVCAACGESYFTARTMHEIERIKSLRASIAVKRSILVAAFEPELA